MPDSPPGGRGLRVSFFSGCLRVAVVYGNVPIQTSSLLKGDKMETILISQLILTIGLLVIAGLVIEGAKYVAPKHEKIIAITTIAITTIAIIAIDIHAQHILMGFAEYREY